MNKGTDKKNTENKVLSYCRKLAMFQNGDRVVLGVSGGADSICLLFVLLELRKILGIDLCVVHVNHGVRADAAEDAAYVESLCREYDIPFMLEEIRLAELAKALGATEEEAGRTARYQAFSKACEKYCCNKIAVAHNSNDRAVTMLFHLFRGTGLKGMGGILPVRDNVVRPLLCLERREIEEYLKAGGILYKQDSTNETDDYTRNRIRHHILPYAEEHIAESCVNNMCRADYIFAEEEAYLKEQTLAAAADCVIAGDCVTDAAGGVGQTGRIEVSAEAFLKYHPVIGKRLLLMLLKRLSPGQQDITAAHIGDILTLFTTPGNRQIHLPYQIRGERIYDKVRLERCVPPAGTSGYDIAVPCLKNVGDKQTVMLPDGSKFIFKVLERPKNLPENQVFFKNMYTKCFDYDKIIKWLNVRTRQTGDYLTIRGNDTIQHKKLKDYMVTEKIPKGERDRIPVLAEDHHILWLAGHRISEHYKVTINTEKILQVKWVQCDKDTL